MNSIRLTTEYQQQYENFVAAHPSGSFLQSWGWGEFQNTQGKEPVRYGAFDDSGQLLASAQFFVTKVPGLRGSYLYCPYGPLSLDTTAVRSLVNQVKKDFPKAWFIRLEPKDDLPVDGKPSVHIQPGSTLITSLSASEADLLHDMHQKTRYNIKVAHRHGVTVQAGKIANAAGIKLLIETSKRQGYKAYPDAYYKQLLNFFADKSLDNKDDCTAWLYVAEHDGQVLASAIMVDHGRTRTYLFGGSSEIRKNVMAPYALHWQAIRDAQTAGLGYYDWWGTETATGKSAGFVQFKMRWGGAQKFYANTRDIILNSPWYLAYTALRKVNRLR